MKFKKAQIAIFIIMVFVLLIGFGFVFYLRGIDAEEAQISATKIQKLSVQDDPVKVYVNECIKQAAAGAAYVFGFQQGYYNSPDPFLDTENSEIAYYYFEGGNIIPKNEVFEGEFSKLMNDELLFGCTDFSIFEDIGYNINYGDINTKTKILEDKVILEIDFPLTISKDSTTKISKFSYTLPFRIGRILDVSRVLVAAVVEEPYALDLTLFLNQDVDVSVFNYDGCNQVYILLDAESKILPTDDDYVFSFGVGFEDQYCITQFNNESFELQPTKRINADPILDPIPDLTAQINQEFTYRLQAIDPDGDTLFYHTTGIVKNHIHILTGLINFTPSIEDVGIHLINVSVIDLKLGIDEKQFYLEVR